jgi:hypothetical protein
VVANDDGRHLGRGQIRVVESFNESTMVFGTEAGTDICPLFETRSSVGTFMVAS